MMKESKRFSNYNFREYALRRVRDGFREGQVETDPSKIAERIKLAEENLSVLRRQVVVGQLYQGDAMVLEAMKKS